ncbi:MAG: hypothetical protein Kow0096_23680 [Thiohalomonadaceae bacterium]
MSHASPVRWSGSAAINAGAFGWQFAAEPLLPTHTLTGDMTMWYFTWILGVLLACAFGVINVMWLESEMSADQRDDSCA